MVYKKIFLIIVVLVLLFVIMACQDTVNNRDYEIVVFEHNANSKSEWDLTQIVNSIDQLETLNLIYDLSEYTNNYDSEFFDDKSLLVVLFKCSYLGAHIEINSLEKKDDILYINMTNKENIFAQHMTAIDYWICVIEINSKSIENIEKVELNYKTKKVII